MEMIQTLPLFPKLDDELIALLKSLSEEEWLRPTLARAWTVKDIASHLLDGNLRTLSFVRDQFTGDPPGQLNSYQDLVDYLDTLNATWVKAMQRVSPAVLTNLLEITGKQYYDCLRSLDPTGPAIFAVDWAGEKESKNWFHIAREYTEKWHHQAQIRQAVNRPGIMTREFYFPMIDTFMRALPHAFRAVDAAAGTVVDVHVTGEQGGLWRVRRSEGIWGLTSDTHEIPSAEISLDPVTAWQLFTKAITPQEASRKVIFKGDTSLTTPVLHMISVIATRKA